SITPVFNCYIVIILPLWPIYCLTSLILPHLHTLYCVASGKPQAQISWILPDRTFVRDVGALDRSASLLANGTLRIQSANFSSKGDYRCIASNAAGADTVTFHIHVAALPPTINEEASESIVIQEGRSVYVHCTAKGEPAPVLKWSLPAGVHVKPSQFLGRRLFVFPNGTLYIKNISPEDSGRYELNVLLFKFNDLRQYNTYFIKPNFYARFTLIQWPFIVYRPYQAYQSHYSAT
uniref:Si:ch211-159i8.4 n=1 Tax=Salmo trutta TaxID=8032 RepID=A0A674B457_SALTR